MTCREKYEKDHPDFSKNSIDDITRAYCPFELGIEYPPDGMCGNSSCEDCWDTDIFEEKKDEQIKEKESKKTMATMTVKKTKAQLVEELDQLKEHTAALEKQLKNMERYKQYEECADEIKAMHTAFVNSGFTDAQAFDLLKTMAMTAMTTQMAKAVVRR